MYLTATASQRSKILELVAALAETASEVEQAAYSHGQDQYSLAESILAFEGETTYRGFVFETINAALKVARYIQPLRKIA
jgi:hypothetical protein